MLDETSVYCVSCRGSAKVSTGTHAMYGHVCQSGCSNFTPVVNNKPIPILGLSRLKSQMSSACMRNVATLGKLATHISRLQHLRLHDISLSVGAVRILRQVLASLPHSVTKLTLEMVPGDTTGHIRLLLFKAIVRMCSFEGAVHAPVGFGGGGDGSACVVLLKGLPHLHVVKVTEVTNRNAFPPDIRFQAISDE